MQKPKIMIGLPTMGSLHTLLVLNILKWMSEGFYNGKYELCVYPTMSVQPVDNARNQIVEEFLKTDCTHLFFIDADTIPPPSALSKLLAADKDIVSALTPIIELDENRKNDSSGYYKKFNVVNMADRHVEPYIGIIPVKGAGGSCILIKRHVFEKLEAPWYRFQYTDDTGKRVMVGEDIYFTIKAIGAGIQPYADTSIVCKHHKAVDW